MEVIKILDNVLLPEQLDAGIRLREEDDGNLYLYRHWEKEEEVLNMRMKVQKVERLAGFKSTTPLSNIHHVADKVLVRLSKGS